MIARIAGRLIVEDFTLCARRNGRFPLLAMAAVFAQSEALVSKARLVDTGLALVTVTVPLPFESMLVKVQQRFASALSFEVSMVRLTVPV